MGCPACHVGKWKHSPRHTRNRLTCRWYDVEPKYYDCPQCKTDQGKNVKGHWIDRPGKCRFAPEEPLQRTGAHPREPRPVANAHPSADTSGVDAEQFEEVKDGGDQNPDESADAAPEASGSQSSTDPTRRGRGPDTVTRTRRTFQDTGVGTTRLPDWTRFNVQISLHNLRSLHSAFTQKELSKLHL